jgi:hypothetical protein
MDRLPPEGGHALMLDELEFVTERRSMKVELHSLTTRYSAASAIPPRELIAMAEASGYDAVFLTERNAVWPRMELAGLRELCDSVRLFPGIEVELDDGCELLVLGAEDPEYADLRAPAEVLSRAAKDGFLTVLVHPYTHDGKWPEYASLVDAIETQTASLPEAGAADSAEAFAAERGLAAVYTGDAQGVNYLNRFWIETETRFDTPQELRSLVVGGRYSNRMRESDESVPPAFKAANIDQLSPEALAALNRPEPSLQD